MQHPVVSREEWLVARAALLAREKAVMQAQDALAAEQRALPWVEIEENYVFEGPDGTLTFAELFDRRSQLFVHHFMISPDDLGLCVGCSFELDHVQGILEHLNAHDITYAVVAPIAVADIMEIRRRMGWRIPWVSSFGSEFTRHIGKTSSRRAPCALSTASSTRTRPAGSSTRGPLPGAAPRPSWAPTATST
jgi:predicted dithiol-disulfide oxidoreductase (DUF899 family)